VMGELELAAAPATTRTAAAGPIASYRDARAAAVADFEAGYLRTLIARAGDNASEAARLARMDRPYLLTLLRKHGLRT